METPEAFRNAGTKMFDTKKSGIHDGMQIVID